MTASNHLLTGAAIAVAVRQPFLAIPLAFVSHFVLDAIPHFGVEEEVEGHNKSNLFWAIFGLDVLLFIVWLFYMPHLLHSHLARWIIISCMLAAYVPDTVWLYRFWYAKITHSYARRGILTRFHKKIQHEYLWGIAVEIVWGSALLGGLIAFSR